MTNALLHIYGQYAEHDDVQIVGNREALLQLRDALNEALEGVNQGRSRVLDAFVGDGEGYDVTIALREDSWDEWGKFIVPYTAHYSAENREDAYDPRFF